MKTATTFLTFLLLFVTALPTQAAKLLTVKNNKALIDLEGEAYSTGNLFLARDSAGKKKAVLEITQVKQGRAIAVLRKGNIQQGYSLERFERPASASDGSTETAASGPSRSRAGFLLGYASSTMNAKTASGTVGLTGSSFNFVGFYSMQLDNKIWAKLLAGYETLNVSGDQSGVNRTVDIGYLGLNAQVEYQLYKGRSWDFFAGAGLGFLYAMNKSSNILDTSKISINNTLVAVVGTNYQISRTSFVPVQLSYSMFPDNSSSSATQIILRAGYGWDF